MITLSDLLYIFGGSILLFVLYYLYRRNKMDQTQKFTEKLITTSDHIEMPARDRAGFNKTDPILADLGFDTVDPILAEPFAKEKDLVDNRAKITQSFNDIIVLHVFAMPKHTFAGYELLQALLAGNLRYGEMNIFHRYQDNVAPQKILFSVASATEPGVFDLQAMGSYSCTGLSLFMRADLVEEPQKVFEMMLATARQLAEDLSGEIYDGEHEPFNKDSLLRYQTILG